MYSLNTHIETASVIASKVPLKILKLLFVNVNPGKKGPPGDTGSPGIPGPPGDSSGYDAAALAAMLGQGSTKGPDPLSSDQPVRMFAGDLSSEEQKKMVLQAYRKLKETFADFSKPDGDKETPAKTCRDLLSAHPDKPSGEVSCHQFRSQSNF